MDIYTGTWERRGGPTDTDNFSPCFSILFRRYERTAGGGRERERERVWEASRTLVLYIPEWKHQPSCTRSCGYRLYPVSISRSALRTSTGERELESWTSREIRRSSETPFSYSRVRRERALVHAPWRKTEILNISWHCLLACCCCCFASGTSIYSLSSLRPKFVVVPIRTIPQSHEISPTSSPIVHFLSLPTSHSLSLALSLFHPPILFDKRARIYQRERATDILSRW